MRLLHLGQLPLSLSTVNHLILLDHVMLPSSETQVHALAQTRHIATGVEVSQSLVRERVGR